MPRRDSDEARKAYYRDYYAKNKDKYYANSRKHAKVRRDRLREYKNKPCADCKQSFPYYVMDFHHVDPKTKKLAIARLSQRATWAVVLAEIEKCVILCANCHRIRTHTET